MFGRPDWIKHNGVTGAMIHSRRCLFGVIAWASPLLHRKRPRSRSIRITTSCQVFIFTQAISQETTTMTIDTIVNKHLTVCPSRSDRSIYPAKLLSRPIRRPSRSIAHPQYTYDNGWKYEFWLKSAERIVYGTSARPRGTIPQAALAEAQ